MPEFWPAMLYSRQLTLTKRLVSSGFPKERDRAVFLQAEVRG
jgi:hypothetical protein